MIKSKILSFTILRYLRNKTTPTVLYNVTCKMCTAIQKTELITNHQIIPFEDIKEETSILEKTNEDLSHQIENAFPSYNFAPYVNKSESLQNLVKLGVNLYKIEKKEQNFEYLLPLDFERDIKPHIRFLGDYVEADQLGKFITKNPTIFKLSMDDMQVRINYLESKKFHMNQIKRIIANNPFWLEYSTMRIDRRLGYFQKTFNLTGEEIRYLATKQPRLITYNFHSLKVNTFTLKEEFGFNDDERRIILLDKPRVWMINNMHLIRRFNYIHNYMKISHEALTKTPEILQCRLFRIKQRHQFLEKINKAQYDPTKPNFVPLTKLAEGTDAEFCFEVAKCPVSDFNLFLKTT